MIYIHIYIRTRTRKMCTLSLQHCVLSFEARRTEGAGVIAGGGSSGFANLHISS